MNKKRYIGLLAIQLILGSVLAMALSNYVGAQSICSNQKTNYNTSIEDDAVLLTDTDNSTIQNSSNGKIPNVMKLVSNACISIILALLINFLIAKQMSGIGKPSKNEQLTAVSKKCVISNPEIKFISKTKQ